MSLYPNAIEYNEAKLRIIGLHPIINGKCGCYLERTNGDDHVCAMPGKHPMDHGWQNKGYPDDFKFEVWEKICKCNGLGWALSEDHIVVDVDPRNGGLESLDKLQSDIGINLFEYCNAIVKTGGNGWHFYFKKDPLSSMGCKMPSKYVGIDIKQKGGFVVIAGSAHASGNEYEWHSAAKSDLENLSLLPESISEMLKRVQTIYSEAAKSAGTTDTDEIADMLSVLDPNMCHEDWVKIGMAIHSATGGSQSGLDTWEKWSSGFSRGKYDASLCSRKWHSFGKYVGSTVNIGTLIRMAEACAWVRPEDKSLLSDDALQAIKESWSKTEVSRVSIPSILDNLDIDIYNPPGVLGQINDFVYSRSKFDNKNLILACSLSIITNIVGRRYCVKGFEYLAPNMIILCVAGSSVGKQSIMNAEIELLTNAGFGAATYGGVRSEKGLLDSFEQNQYAMYAIDEFGQFFEKASGGGKKGGASHMDGVVRQFLSGSTSTNMVTDGSRRSDFVRLWQDKFNRAKKASEEGETKANIPLEKEKVIKAKWILENLSNSIKNPFLSLFGTATPMSMKSVFNAESSENGFLSRAMVFYESETNPLPRTDFEYSNSIPLGLSMALKSIAFKIDYCPFGRVDAYQQDIDILPIDSDAQIFLDRAQEYFYDLAEEQKDRGLESLPRRCIDNTIKICVAMGAGDGRITLTIARYAVKIVIMEVKTKIDLVMGAEDVGAKDESIKADGMRAKIKVACKGKGGLTIASIKNQFRGVDMKINMLQRVVDRMVEIGDLEIITSIDKRNNKELIKFKTLNAN